MLLDILIVLALVVLFVLYYKERRKRLARERDLVQVHDMYRHEVTANKQRLREQATLSQQIGQLQAAVRHKDALLLELANREVNGARR